MFEKRCELKFVSNDIFYSNAINWIKKNKINFTEHYPSRFVNSIYFDSYSYNSFKENLFGDSKKTKTRYRWYGNLISSALGFFEIKKRKNVYNYKKIIQIEKLNINEDCQLREILNSIKIYLKPDEKLELEARPFPTILNRYYREYFIDFTGNVRVTIDRNIKIFDQRLSNKINLKKKINYPNLMIIEFKFKQTQANNFTNFFNYFPFRLSRNSKYINAIRAVASN